MKKQMKKQMKRKFFSQKNKIRQKLNSDRGASMLLAMLLFLLATMVSIVIVSAALSGAKTIDTDTEEEQDILTLQSAAELVNEEIANHRCVVQTIVTEGKTSKTTRSITASGAFARELETGVSQSASLNTNYSGSGITIQGDQESYKDVEMSFVMMNPNLDDGNADDAYKLIITLNIKDTGECINLTFGATQNKSEAYASSGFGNSATKTTTTTQTITWNEASYDH